MAGPQEALLSILAIYKGISGERNYSLFGVFIFLDVF
jgi:hypothetical protein